MSLVAIAALLQASIGPESQLEQAGRARTGWEVCAVLQATNYASLKEGADVLADGAMSKCANGEAEFKTAVSLLQINEQGQRFDSEHLTSIVSDERVRIHGRAVTAILDARLKAERSKK